MDSHPKYVGADEGDYILNQQVSVNTNGGSNNGASLGIATPLPANYPACELELPAGENYSPNTYHSKLTNETYDWVLNTNEANVIKRVNGKGICEIVYQDECLKLSADPKHAIHQFRAYMKIDRLCKHAHGKQLVWTDGLNAIGQIDVEAAIATNSFTTPFFQICPDPCSYIRMCVPDPCDVITVEAIPLPLGDNILTNKINDRAFQFTYRHIYYDGRASEWAIISRPFFQSTDGCFESVDDLPRCLKLRLPIGNPLVEKIEIAFREGNSNQWHLYDTIEKYNPYTSPQQMWYERTLAPVITSSNFEDCSFDYVFCNDKKCQSIEIDNSRVYNPMPREPQGILEVDNSIGFYNYKQGNCPVSKTEIDKFDIGLECDTASCINETAIVTVRAIINEDNRRNQYVWREGGTFGGDDDPNDVAKYGGHAPNNNITFHGWGQEFSEKRRNITAFIEGTEYFGEMKQWITDRLFVNRSEYGIVSDGTNPNVVNTLNNMIVQGKWFYQEYTFRVPKGTKGWIRLANQDITGGHDDTSMALSVNGLFADIRNYRVNDNRINNKEIYFDTCNGDVELMQAFDVRAAPSHSPIDGITNLRVFNGYISDNNNKRVEFAEVWGTLGGTYMLLAVTDWNGFYYFEAGQDSMSIDIKVERDCASAWQTIKSLVLTGTAMELTSTDIKITDTDYANGFHEIVKVPVRDCNNELVSGVRVAMSGSKYATSVNGIAEFIVRNKSTRNRAIQVIVMDAKGCFSNDCNGGCDACLPISDSVVLQSCLAADPDTLTIEVNGRININSTGKKIGLKSGGRYPFGFYLKADCGKKSAVYELPYMDIPRTQDTGSLNFCSFRYNGNGITLPGWKCLSIVRGENENRYELQWVVDKVERTVDNKIKLTIQSLSDYNASYFFKTNTVYQWLKGDRIEFIRNGDNEVFLSSVHGILNYLTVSPFHDEAVSGDADAPADFFNQLLIEDNGKLDDLVKGAIIELKRDKECEVEPTYYDIGVSIPIDENGHLVNDTGVFDTYDTYILKVVIGGNQAQEFEHHSPSHFWGDRYSDIGKAHFANKYENEKRYGRSITFNSPTQFNYFGDIIKHFDAPGQGDITAMWIGDGRIILAICEHDNFMAQSADDLVRVGNDGTIRALPADAIISDGEPKLIGQYGCQYPHIGSILFGDGFAMFWDVNAHGYIIHNYQFAKIAATSIGQDGNVISKCNSYFRKRSQGIEFFNRNEPDFYNHFRFATGQDKNTGLVYCTIKSLRHSGINNEIAPYLKPNETIIYEPATDIFRGFASHTPESYSNLDLFDGDGCGFITYLNGVPYIHPVIAHKWNEFYGVAVDWMVSVCLNKFPEKRKVALSIEKQSNIMWFVKSVVTDKPTFQSEIPPIKIKFDNGKWNANYLGNANSREGLHRSTELPKGYYVKTLFIRDNTDALKYNTTNDAKRTIYSELDQIIIKFAMSEQSGMTENL